MVPTAVIRGWDSNRGEDGVPQEPLCNPREGDIDANDRLLHSGCRITPRGNILHDGLE